MHLHYYLFYNCTKLKSIDVSSFKTSNVVDMGWVFYGCEELEYIDISNF